MNRITKSLAAAAGLAGAAYAGYVTNTWFRYGHAKRVRDDARDALLDEFMGDYDVRERHEVAVAAPADVALAAAQELDLDGSPIVRAIFRAREALLRSKPEAARRPKGLIEAMKSIGWGVLAESPGREIVMGGVTKPWEPNPVFRALPPDRFAAFAEPDCVKIVWTLRVTPEPGGGSIFSTETRAVATDARARGKFRAYWSLLSPGIVLVRLAMLPLLKAAADRRWRIEGDDIVADARAQLTHVVTIDAPPRDVWPWLVQMGCRRAGWYSWDALDNAGVRSADHIVPELQHLAVGDVLPARPVGAGGFKVLRLVPERALVLDGTSPQWAGTWAFELQPFGANKTRLVTRYRASYPPNTRIALPILAAVHAFMERKQLRTIKHHAERMHAAA
ncbi:MAG TPA: hypothetical protein VKU41_28120 [Polyangiaceae bacterium]|nr:hypothetical protein [Polyangiaceae bacterium]